ncbi:MAG: hypothetical protein AAFZ07_29780, partial [Actinomycetota bacterium]
EAKQALIEIKTPAAMLKRALGDDGFAQFQEERGVAEEYSLTPVQADAILNDLRDRATALLDRLAEHVAADDEPPRDEGERHAA